ncbi:HEAT repeat domain-containing protein [Streptomyces sp. NBC_01498]|uniref:HEAT repeat domain-containing protein n=1 Tax=Streptomyces sp. NBC_01498 TaxID=2975870 RepID=UPI002E7BC378|nr:HEAT repeat domain-containing protein [Streptomyces sp. NBC_01498]WTL23843.1 HEAT repeat domain-containing protein [Streptomyces sp. NBC_01498]
MDLAQIFADLDAQPWEEREHAYGSAEDVPGQLRALASDDAGTAEEALYELYGNIVHQGSVYEATAHAVPYPARLAAAGIRPAEMLQLLGCVAESDDERSDAVGACRAAVVEQLPLILPLIGSADSDVRRSAVWAAARTGAAEQVLPVLRRCWEEERDPLVRAEVLTGTAWLDPASAAEFDRSVLAAGGARVAEEPVAEEPVVRLAALLACADAELPWTTVHHDAFLALLPADPLVAERFDQERTEPLRYLVDQLLERDTDDAREAALALTEAGLRHPDAEAREEAIGAAEHACQASRTAPARLTGPLTALLGDPASADSALSVVGQLGEHATTAVPVLTTLATEDGPLADRALAVLVATDPDRAAPLLAAELPRRPRALDAAAKASPGGWTGAGRDGDPGPFPFTTALLDAVRARLAQTGIGWNEAIHLGLLLFGWGERAAPAVPDLLAALDRHPFVVLRALPAVCPAEERERVARALRAADLTGQSPLDVGSALHRLTGETGPLVRAVMDVLAVGDRDVSEAAKAAGELTGTEAADLLPHLREALSDAARKAPDASEEEGRTNPRLDADTEIARALWRITGSADEALPVVAGVLEDAEGDWTRWQNVRAAGAAGALGTEGRPLAPLLEGKLDHPDHAAAAALALLAVDPSGRHGTRLADAALTSAETNADPNTALDFLRAYGARNLTDDQLRRWTHLAERDAPVYIPGLSHDTVRADTRFREQTRLLLRGTGEAS